MLVLTIYRLLALLLPSSTWEVWRQSHYNRSLTLHLQVHAGTFSIGTEIIAIGVPVTGSAITSSISSIIIDIGQTALVRQEVAITGSTGSPTIDNRGSCHRFSCNI